MPSTALLTDQYELTMVQAALRNGTARRRCVFEVFARRLPPGRRYGVVAGTARLLDAMTACGFENYANEWWHYTFKPEPTPHTAYDVPVR